MTIRSCPFGGDDDARLLVDIVTAAAPDRRCNYWHVGDVWWGLYQNTVFEPRDNIRVWLDDETPVGFAWFYPRGGISTLVRPDYTDGDGLHEEMLCWAEERRRALPRGDDSARRLTATAFAHDARRIALLEKRGYARSGTPMRHFHRSLSESVPNVASPVETTVRHVVGEVEWAERVALHREVWNPSRVTIEAYRRLRVTQGYMPELDLVAVAPDGVFASYCICWLDPVNRTGEFEPVGTRPAYQRQGFSRAVITEGLRRLKARGATDATVLTPQSNEPAVALYESVGFRVAGSEYDYVKEIC